MSDTTETEPETETGTTDEPSKAELHERVRKLESTVEKLMPSRRDALKLGAAGLAGAVGLSATSQSVDASTGSAGQIGDPSNRPDLFTDEIDVNGITGGVSPNDTITDLRGNYERIAFDSDSSNGGLNLSVTGLPDKPQLRFVVEIVHNDTNAANLECTFNNNTTSNYNYTEIGSSITTTTGDSSFALARNINRPLVGAFVLAGGNNRQGASRIREPIIGVDYVAHDSPDPNLYQGRLNDSSAFPVSSIELSTGGEAVGEIRVEKIIT